MNKKGLVAVVFGLSIAFVLPILQSHAASTIKVMAADGGCDPTVEICSDSAKGGHV
jgi:hypothetical protein